jgi:S-adenosylmethionine-diacylglycerol 3-amino-3-carboxypropyl transferase
MTALSRTWSQRRYDASFQRTHGHKLIYNSCWEDPKADRNLLALRADSHVLSITSGGCNALDYLLDDPARIDCIDVNPWQNALLELKLVALQVLPYADFFQIFASGRHSDFKNLYSRFLRPELSHPARVYWDENQHFFDAKNGRGSFYFYGTTGDVAFYIGRALRIFRPDTHRKLMQLMDAQSLSDQRALYAEIEPAFWNVFTRWLMRQPTLLTLLGVPRAQRDLIEKQFPGGLSQYVQEKLRYVFTQIPVSENYFWRVYLTGEYTATCCPNYLKAGHYQTLRKRANRLHWHTNTISGFLQQCHKHGMTSFSHYVLLDHQDWMASEAPAALEQEWRLILSKAAPAAKVLMRSGAPDIDFLPAFAVKRLRRMGEAERHWHQLDRVGTYGSTLLATII